MHKKIKCDESVKYTLK